MALQYTGKLHKKKILVSQLITSHPFTTLQIGVFQLFVPDIFWQNIRNCNILLFDLNKIVIPFSTNIAEEC